MRDLIRPEYRDRAREAAATAGASRTDYDNEYPVEFPDGRVAWIAVRGRGVYDDQGKLIRMFGVAQDVTARKEAEASLRESEGLHRFLVGLASATQPLTDPADVMAVAARLLAEHLWSGPTAPTPRSRTSPSTSSPGTTPRSPEHRRPLARGRVRGRAPPDDAEAGEPYVVKDADADPRIGADDLPAYRATAIRAVICVPLHKGGSFTAAMAVHQIAPAVDARRRSSS